MRNRMAGAAPNIPEYSVSEIANAVRRTLQDRFPLVRVRGELSGFKVYASGHAYFDLKDADAVMSGVMWKGNVGKLGFRAEDGLEVIATGRISAYPKSSRFQLVVEQMEVAGIGALLKQIEERRLRLQAEGLFDRAAKPPKPFLPRHIGVVTSPHGAVIRDILHRLAERFPRRVTLWPAPVQGQGAADKIAQAIRGFNQLPPPRRPDLLIVARGGGSVEDLMAFNEEVVVRAAAASRIPLISAVGHETDTTLIDFASALRAPTPSAAAEVAVPVRAELEEQVATLMLRARRGERQQRRYRAERLEALARRLPQPAQLAGIARQRLDEAGERLPRALGGRLRVLRLRLAAAGDRLPRPAALAALRRQRLQGLAARLAPAHAAQLNLRRVQLHAIGGRLTPRLLSERLARQRARLAAPAVTPNRQLLQARLAAARAALQSTFRLAWSLSPEAVLDRGFVLVHAADGTLLRRAAELPPAGAIRLRFADGEAPATLGAAGTAAPPAAPQGGLF